MYGTDVDAGVLRVAGPGARWLSTSWNGGFVDADAAYNVSVPDGFERHDLAAYAHERRSRADFEPPGPTLLTGVDVRHARGASMDAVTCVATAGVSNPATLPMDPTDTSAPRSGAHGEAFRPGTGTVNVIVGTTRGLDDGALAAMLASVVEAKTATLLARTGFTGTTTDAVIVGTDPAGTETSFAGSGTPVGNATRACVREAVSASLNARYASTPLPASVADADHGTTTTAAASVFDPNDTDA